jgi:serine/threonine-protein kinase
VPAAPPVIESSLAAAKPNAEKVPAAQAPKAMKATAPELGKSPPLAADKAAKMEMPVAKKNEARKEAVTVAKVDGKPTGTLEFWINPFGDVFIDGKQVGTSPPLKVYKLPAGTHQVEIYNDNAGFPYKLTVDVKADQVSRVTKTFSSR